MSPGPNDKPNVYKALREMTGLSQRAVETALGWDKHGRLSVIERGLVPTPEEHRALAEFYAVKALDVTREGAQ
jgi:hypothetical protein